MPPLHRLVIVAALGALASCPATPTRPPVPANHDGAAPGFAPARLYARLFEPGASWTFSVDHAVHDGASPHADPDGWVRTSQVVRCAVVDTRRAATAAAARIACARPMLAAHSELGEPIAGWWIADARGLWRHRGDDPTAAVLAALEPPDAELVIAATPVAGDSPPAPRSSSVRRDGARWCAEQSLLDADGPGFDDDVCFADSGFATARSEELDVERVDLALAPATP